MNIYLWLCVALAGMGVIMAVAIVYCCLRISGRISEMERQGEGPWSGEGVQE